VQAIYQGLVLCYIIGSMEMESTNVKESITPRRHQHYTSPGTVEGEGAIEVHAPMLVGDSVGAGGLL
jgi:hypothetical protein